MELTGLAEHHGLGLQCHGELLMALQSMSSPLYIIQEAGLGCSPDLQVPFPGVEPVCLPYANPDALFQEPFLLNCMHGHRCKLMQVPFDIPLRAIRCVGGPWRKHPWLSQW